jgi:hypothetical protein
MCYYSRVMTLRDRIRAFLGTDLLIDIPSLTMFKAMEQKQRDRHEELLGAVSKLTMVLQNAHIADRQAFAPPVLDWDTVQAMALASLEREPQKEQN